MVKECSKCGLIKEFTEFHFRDKSKGIRHSQCIVCWRARCQSYYVKNKDKWEIYKKTRSQEAKHLYYQKNKAKQNAQCKSRYKNRRIIVVEKYGGICKCCGDDRIDVLTIDHRNSDGAAERSRQGYKTFLKKLSESEPDFSKYRLLCWNCNSAYGFYGYCPHQKKSANFWPENLVGLARCEKIRLWKHKVRKRVINIYGGLCAICGEDKYEFLALDHVHGGGTLDRKIRAPFTMYTEVYKANKPIDIYRILCHNCNNLCYKLSQRIAK